MTSRMAKNHAQNSRAQTMQHTKENSNDNTVFTLEERQYIKALYDKLHVEEETVVDSSDKVDRVNLFLNRSIIILTIILISILATFFF